MKRPTIRVSRRRHRTERAITVVRLATMWGVLVGCGALVLSVAWDDSVGAAMHDEMSSGAEPATLAVTTNAAPSTAMNYPLALGR